MATSSYDSAYVVGATTIAVPPGATLAVQITPVQYLISSTVRIHVAGGTLSIVGCNYGSSLAAASLVAQADLPLGASQIVTIPGPASYYLKAIGATTTASVQFLYSQGASLA